MYTLHSFCYILSKYSHFVSNYKNAFLISVFMHSCIVNWKYNWFDFCMLVLYSETLLNSIVSSKSYYYYLFLGIFYIDYHAIFAQRNSFFLLVYMPFYILSLPMALAKFCIIMLVRMGEQLPCFIPLTMGIQTLPLSMMSVTQFLLNILYQFIKSLYFMLF